MPNHRICLPRNPAKNVAQGMGNDAGKNAPGLLAHDGVDHAHTAVKKPRGPIKMKLAGEVIHRVQRMNQSKKEGGDNQTHPESHPHDSELLSECEIEAGLNVPAEKYFLA